MMERITYVCGKTYDNPVVAQACTPWVQCVHFVYEVEGEPPIREYTWKSYVVIPPPKE